MDPHYLEDLPESPTTRILSGTASGLGIGAVVGSIFANWAELPQTLPGRSALGVTGDLVISWGCKTACPGVPTSISTITQLGIQPALHTAYAGSPVCIAHCLMLDHESQQWWTSG